MLEKRVQNLFARYPRKALQRRDIADMLNLHGGERKRLTAILRQLVGEGAIEQKKGTYRLGRRQQKSISGVLSVAERGYGFVRPDEEGQQVLFIAEKHLAAAMHGDQVVAQQTGVDRQGRPYGRIRKVVRRAHRTLVGVFHQQRGRAWVVPFDRMIAGTVFVRLDESEPAEPGQVVKLEFIRYPSATVAGSGRIVEVLGEQGDPQVDIDTVIHTHELPREFSAAALEQAAQLASDAIPAAALEGRTDLRSLPLMTIDGETAKDFDDAVAIAEEPDGRFRLWVCIADVAHYVAENSPLDQAALERGTSVYFPGYCLPMLPELLSNGICSLNPAEDRLVMTAELVIDQNGTRLQSEFYPAIIRSRARLTYTRVAAFLDAGDDSDLPAEISQQLPLMASLAQQLTEMRRQRGSLELDVPDVEIVLGDDGFPAAVSKSERNLAHRLIEEFMLAANEAVASFLEQRNYQFLYRIHEPPTADKLQEFQQLAAECSVGLVLGKNLHHELQRLLTEIEELPEARLLNQQLLRSLQQARYTPINKGHFGLAAPCYCHFTSPIRRYPDLLVHRALKQAVLAARSETGEIGQRVLSLGEECSEKERRAMAAERDLLELRRCQLMQEQIGAEFDGIISSVTEFGFFVELTEQFVEGLVHVRSLQGDYYQFEPTDHTLIGERKRTVFRVGKAVRVRVEKVDLWRRRLDFALVD